MLLADKGKSLRFSLRSPGNAKPEIDERKRRNIVTAIRRRSVPSKAIERGAPQHPGNFAYLVDAFGPLPDVPQHVHETKGIRMRRICFRIDWPWVDLAVFIDPRYLFSCFIIDRIYPPMV